MIVNRLDFYLFRDQPQTFRRGTARQTSDGWRRSRGDDDDNNEQGEDSPIPVNGSSSWTSRNGPAKRVNSNGSMEQRTKSNDKWNYNDDRSGINKKNLLSVLELSFVFSSRFIK
jgi:hypothetical protein